MNSCNPRGNISHLQSFGKRRIMHVQDGTGPFKHCVSTGHSLFSSVFNKQGFFPMYSVESLQTEEPEGMVTAKYPHLVKEDVQTDWLQTPHRNFKSNEASNRR